MPNLLLSFDVGTSGTKTTLFTEDGKLLKSSTAGYEVHYSNPGWTEEDPLDWWGAVIKTSKAVLQDIDASDIAAISFSGQMSGALLLDDHQQIIRPHILWSDTRAWREGEEILASVDPAEHFSMAGKPPGPSRMLEKLMWLRKNEPDHYARIWKVIQAKDYIAFRLTGNVFSDHTDAGSTYLFDRKKRVYSKELLALGDIPEAIMPEAVPSTQIIGRVTAEAARLTGLTEGTPVVMGAGDVCSATIGARCIESGQMHFCIGSSSWCGLTLDHPIQQHEHCYSMLHVIDGLYVNNCTLAASGISYKWLRNILHDMDIYPDHLYNRMNQLAEASPAGANGILYLPYLLGDQSLFNNPNATGAYVGLRADHTRGDIIRATLEGVCHYLTASAHLFAENAAIQGSPMLLGGATKGSIWGDILSSMLDMPCLLPQFPEEATSIGAAVIAGVGIGLFKDFSIAEKFSPVHRIAQPDPEKHKLYSERLPVFMGLFKALEPYFGKL